MSEKKTDQAVYAAGQAREFLSNALDGKENTWIYEYAGYVDDPKVLDWLNYHCSIYEDHGENFLETRKAQIVLASAGTHTANDAFAEGNPSQLQGLVGLVDHTDDAADPSTRDWMRRRVVDSAYVGFITGGMGKGKTDFAIELSDGWQYETRGQIASNMDHFTDQDKCIQDFDTLEDWFKKGGDKLFIFDESGQEAKGGGQSGLAAQVLGKMIRLIRKAEDGNPDDKRCILFIDQTEMGIEKDLRRLVREAGDTWRKRSPQVVEVHEDIVDGLSDKPTKTIRNIPKTRLNYNTNRGSEFDLISALEDEYEADDPEEIRKSVYKEQAIRSYLNNNDMSYRDVAEDVLNNEFGKSWVSDRVHEWKKGQHRDLVDANEVDFDPED